MSKVSYDYEHWSSPNGCAEGCPACANETRKESERDRILEDIAAVHRLHAAAPALLAACRAIVDAWACGDLASAARQCAAAIALTEPPKATP